MRAAVVVSGTFFVLIGTCAVARADGPSDVIDLGKGVRILASRVSAATFVQGSPPTDEMREADEDTRQVRISRDLYVSTTPVTRAAFTVFADETGYRTEAETGKSGGSGWDGAALTQAPRFNWRTPGFAQGDAHPVVIVTYKDAQAFAEWVAKRSGRSVRLPSEAEYELAARGGTTTRWSSGDKKEDALSQGWFKQNAGQGTQPVGMRVSNGFGLFDMSGNVYEWCRDAYGLYAIPEKPPLVDPVTTQGPSGEPLRRVLRGGSWLRDPKNGRSAARYRATEGTRSAEIGFRVVWDASPGGPSSGATSPSSARGATADAASTSASSDSGAPTSFFAIAGAVVAALVGVLIALVRGSRRTTAATAARGGGRAIAGVGSAGVTGVVAPPGVMVEIVDDGFWIRTQAMPAGTSLRYHVVAGGESSHGVAVLVPAASGTYVYTGARPASVRIYDPNASSTAASSPISSRTYGTAAGFAQPQTTGLVSDDARTYGTASRIDDGSSSSSSSSSFIGYPPAY